MLKKQLAAFLFCIIFNISSHASHISVSTYDPILVEFGFSYGSLEWDTEVIVNLGSKSKRIVTDESDGNTITRTESEITGDLYVYLNSSNDGEPIVGINFDNTSMNLDQIDLRVIDNPTTTNLLTYYELTYDQEEACQLSDYTFCRDFYHGNSRPTSHLSLGSIETAHNIELNLGAISLTNTGNNTIANLPDPYPEDQHISFSLILDDFPYKIEYVFTSSAAVPLPASIWFLVSGSIALIGFGKRATT